MRSLIEILNAFTGYLDMAQDIFMGEWKNNGFNFIKVSRDSCV